jgi:hypothetical protein
VATQAPATTKLEALVESFDRDTLSARNQIRELLENDPTEFQDGALRVFKSLATSRGAQFVVGLLLSSNNFVPTLCDATLNLREAVSMARMALQLDPMLDANLAKKLADEAAVGGPVANFGRLLDVLGEISTGSRITPSLMRLLRSPDPEMRSKVVLLIGRSIKSVQWVQNRLAETDPRTRANAVETLWGMETVEARKLLRTVARDGHNRVAANALIALYRMGDVWTIPELFKMAASDSPMFRASAAWAMGESGDPRFSETLARMVGESNAIVRKRAFSALSRLKAAVTMTRQGREWRVAGRSLQGAGSTRLTGILRREPRQFSLEVTCTDASPPPQLLATQFILTEDRQPISHYQVEMCPVPEVLEATLLFPRPTDSGRPGWIQGAIDGLRYKRPADLCSSMFYLAGGDTPETTPNSPKFSSDRDAIVAAIEKPPGKMECAPFWNCLRTALRAATPSARVARHLIVYNQSSAKPPEDMAPMFSAAMSSNTAVHVVSLTSSATLEELCRRTRGSFDLAQSPDELSHLVEQTYLGLLPRFLVTCLPAPGSRKLKFRVFDPTGWGEITIAL